MTKTVFGDGLEPNTVVGTDGYSLDSISSGPTGYVLTSNGSATPTFQPGGGSGGNATNIIGGSAGKLLYQTGISTTGFVNVGPGVLVATGGVPHFTKNIVDPLQIITNTNLPLQVGSTYGGDSAILYGFNNNGRPIILLESNGIQFTQALDDQDGSVTNNGGLSYTWTNFNEDSFSFNSNGTLTMSLYSAIKGLMFMDLGQVTIVSNDSAGKVLTSNGPLLPPSWATPSVSLTGGTAGTVVYQTSSTTTGFTNTATGFLVSAGLGATPAFNTTISFPLKITNSNIVPLQIISTFPGDTLMLHGFNNNGRPTILLESNTREYRQILSNLDGSVTNTGGLSYTWTNTSNFSLALRSDGNLRMDKYIASRGLMYMDLGVSSVVSTGAAGTYLQSNGPTLAPVWVNIPASITGGAAGTVVYQTAVSTTGFTNTATGVLLSTGVGATPAFSTTVNFGLIFNSSVTQLTCNASNAGITANIGGRNFTVNGSPAFNLQNNIVSYLKVLDYTTNGIEDIQANSYTWRNNTSGSFGLTAANRFFIPNISANFLTTNSLGEILNGANLFVSPTIGSPIIITTPTNSSAISSTISGGHALDSTQTNTSVSNYVRLHNASGFDVYTGSDGNQNAVLISDSTKQVKLIAGSNTVTVSSVEVRVGSTGAYVYVGSAGVTQGIQLDATVGITIVTPLFQIPSLGTGPVYCNAGVFTTAFTPPKTTIYDTYGVRTFTPTANAKYYEIWITGGGGGAWWYNGVQPSLPGAGGGGGTITWVSTFSDTSYHVFVGAGGRGGTPIRDPDLIGDYSHFYSNNNNTTNGQAYGGERGSYSAIGPSLGGAGGLGIVNVFSQEYIARSFTIMRGGDGQSGYGVSPIEPGANCNGGSSFFSGGPGGSYGSGTSPDSIQGAGGGSTQNLATAKGADGGTGYIKIIEYFQ